MEDDLDNLVFVVCGATLRAEEMDRPLAYRIQEAVYERLEARDSELDCMVISDIWYLNNKAYHERPTISIGGPGVNHVSAYWWKRLDSVLNIENVLLIQMSLDKPPRACLWGMDHDHTVEALETFQQKGHLDRFVDAIV